MSTKTIQQAQAQSATHATPSAIQGFAFDQYLGNQAEAEAVQAEPEQSGWLSWFAAGMASDAPSVGDWTTPLDEKGNAHSTPARNILDAPKLATTTIDGTAITQTSLSTSGASAAVGTRKANDEGGFLGTDHTDLQATGSIDASGRIAGGGRVSNRMFESGKKDGLVVSAGATLDNRGRLDAGLAAKVDGVAGASVDGMVDVGQDGIEAVGLTVGGNLEKATASLGVYGQATDVEVRGNEVSWSSGYGANFGLAYDGIGSRSSADDRSSDSIRFPSEAEATAYGERVQAGEVGRNDTLSANDVAALPEGTRLTYLRAQTVSRKGGVVAGFAANQVGTRQVSIDRVDGSALVVKVTHDRLDSGELSAERVGAVSAGAGRIREADAEYTVDLADAAQAAAFERFQATGDASALSLKASVQLDGREYTGGKAVPGISVKQTGSVLQGERIEDGARSRLDVGRTTESVGTTDACDLLAVGSSVMATVGWNQFAPVKSVFDRAGRGFDRAGAYCEATQSTPDGTSRSDVTVDTPMDGGPQTLRTHQVFDLDDQQQLARALLDFTTPGYDEDEVDSSLLPGVERTEDQVEVECLIDAAGTARAAQMLFEDPEFDMEYGANKYAPSMFEDARRRVAEGEDRRTVFAETTAQMGRLGGEDYAEKVRQLSPENTECFAKIDGTGFIGREANESVDRLVATLKQDVLDDVPGAFDRLVSVLDEEARRADLLEGHGIPEALRMEEESRIFGRIDSSLGGVR